MGVYQTLTWVAIALIIPTSAIAQSLPPSAPEIIEHTIPQPTESPLPTETPTPSQPSLQTPSVIQPPSITSPMRDRFFVKKVEVLGNTVLKDKITELTKVLENRNVTFEDLLKLRADITQLYIDNSYVTSGAFLPNNQDLSSGIVQIQVVEGELEAIELSGLQKLRAGYVRSRLEIADKKPLNRQHLEQALQLLQLDPLISRVNAELTAGSTPGRNILQVSLQEAPAFTAGIGTENRQSPSIGSLQASVFATHNNLLGFGDRLSAEYGITEGLNIYDLNYTIPVNARDGTLNLRYGNSDSRIIEAQFRDFDIKSDTRTFSVGWRQPVVRSPETEFALSLGVDLRRSQTFLGDEAFPFSEGTDNGKSKVTALRFVQDWVKRGTTNVLAAR